MALESATHLNDLVATNPVAGDQVSEGDDHIRLIKNVLKTTFPGLTAPVTLGPTDLPQFGGVNVGHASDTTLTRASAGRLAVEGDVIPSVGAENTFTGTNHWGTFSTTGATNGAQRLTSGPARINSSVTVTTAERHAAYYNPNGGVGNVETSGSGTLFNTSSDARDKVDLGREPDGRDRLRAIPVHRTRFKTDPEGSERPMFFAQEVELVLPHVVSTDPDTGKKFVSYGDFVPTLWVAVQDHDALLLAQQEQIAAQQDVITSLVARIEALEARP